MPGTTDNLYAQEGPTSGTLLGSKWTGTRHLPATIVGQMARTYDGVQTLNLTAASQSLTVPGSATHADIQAISVTATDYCRFWDGGGTPSAAVGMTMGPGSPSGSFWESASPATFKAINSNGSIALSVAYFHYS